MGVCICLCLVYVWRSCASAMLFGFERGVAYTPMICMDDFEWNMVALCSLHWCPMLMLYNDVL
jgi:hypothetical protein